MICSNTSAGNLSHRKFKKTESDNPIYELLSALTKMQADLIFHTLRFVSPKAKGTSVSLLRSFEPTFRRRKLYTFFMTKCANL